MSDAPYRSGDGASVVGPRPPMRARELWRATLLYSALTVALAYPISLHPGSIGPRYPDTNLFLWTLQWDVHALTHQPWAIFDANIYYPEQRTLAYSENLLGSALLAAPILWLTGNPVLAMNLIVLMACMLCGLGTYMLARRLGVGPCGATLSGLIFAFSPPRFLRLDQLHLATIQWIPFCLAFLHAYWDGGRKRDARLAAMFFTLQALTSGHGAVFLMTAIAVLVCYRIATGASRLSAGWIRDLDLAGAALLLPTALVLLPYHTVQQEMGLRRTLENWSVPWVSFVSSPTHVHVALLSLVPSWHINDPAWPTLFPGVMPIVLAIAAFTMRRRRAPTGARLAGTAWTRLALVCDLAALACVGVGVWIATSGIKRIAIAGATVVTIHQAWRPWLFAAVAVAARVAMLSKAPIQIWKRLRLRPQAFERWRAAVRDDARFPYALVTIVAFLLAAGPPVSVWPLVYWLPGLNFIRAPSRFTLLEILGLAILAGMGFERLAARGSRLAHQWLAIGVGALLVAEFAVAPLGSPQELEPYRGEAQAIDRWLASQPKPFVIAEVPLANPAHLNEWEGRQTVFMLHSTAHWQKTVQGYSGFRSQLHETLYARMTTFPDALSLQSLADLGVTDVVVHTDLYPPDEWASVEDRIARAGDWLKLEHVEGAGRVYSIRRPR